MITENRDGTLRFEYELKVKPCIKCGCTHINLFEMGGRTYFEDVDKSSGGGICKVCGNTVVEYKLPVCPNMNMLLEVWNRHN
jgi:hypothetical protein